MLEVMITATILVLAITAALKVYLDSSILVAQSKNRTRAVTHAKVIAEEIRSWNNITNQNIQSTNWGSWISTQTNGDLLPQETVAVQSGDWVQGESTSPRKVTISISWIESGRINIVTLVGGMI